MITAYKKVLNARSKDRPVASDYIKGLFTGFMELHGDRKAGDDTSVVSGIALLKGTPVTVIGIEKGKDTNDKIYHHFGAAHPEGYRKALRLMKQAEKFSRPVICLVDTAGAFCGIDAEEHGQGQAIAENLAEMMTLKTPVVSIVIGEGGSGGALALAVADEVWMLSGAYYSVVSPESCANILWKDPEKAPRAAELLRLTATDLQELGIIERVIQEPKDYDTGVFPKAFFAELAEQLDKKIKELSELSESELLSERYEKFRKIGKVENNF